MKKSFLTLAPALVIIAVTMSSCADKCCTMLTAKICESDMPIGYNNWDAYAESLEANGYNCN